jgi:hypothetical protein
MWLQFDWGEVACIDATLRIIGGAPTYLLTDNIKDRHHRARRRGGGAAPQMVGLGRFYGCKVGDAFLVAEWTATLRSGTRSRRRCGLALHGRR